MPSVMYAVLLRWSYCLCFWDGFAWTWRTL